MKNIQVHIQLWSVLLCGLATDRLPVSRLKRHSEWSSSLAIIPFHTDVSPLSGFPIISLSISQLTAHSPYKMQLILCISSSFQVNKRGEKMEWSLTNTQFFTAQVEICVKTAFLTDTYYKLIEKSLRISMILPSSTNKIHCSLSEIISSGRTVSDKL